MAASGNNEKSKHLTCGLNDCATLAVDVTSWYKIKADPHMGTKRFCSCFCTSRSCKLCEHLYLCMLRNCMASFLQTRIKPGCPLPRACATTDLQVCRVGEINVTTSFGILWLDYLVLLNPTTASRNLWLDYLVLLNSTACTGLWFACSWSLLWSCRRKGCLWVVEPWLASICTKLNSSKENWKTIQYIKVKVLLGTKRS